MAVTLPATVLSRYRRFSLYDSPFVAHDRGRAIDLYPEGATRPGPGGETAPSPVAGEVREVRRVRAPPRPHARDEDYLLLVDVDDAGDRVARIVHVEPSVAPGETVAVGDSLGECLRTGFFAPWVPNHLHLEFRPRDADPYRATGSVPVEPGLDPTGLAWDGTGTVVERGATWARLDRPVHPAPGEAFVGLANEAGPGVVDGGCPHYERGGLLSGGYGGDGGPVALAGTRVGTATGRTVDWRDVTVLANGEPVAGLSLGFARDRAGATLVGEGADLSIGTDVRVRVSASGDDP